jgi:hypothetical protein
MIKLPVVLLVASVLCLLLFVGFWIAAYKYKCEEEYLGVVNAGLIFIVIALFTFVSLCEILMEGSK